MCMQVSADRYIYSYSYLSTLGVSQAVGLLSQSRSYVCACHTLWYVPVESESVAE